MRLNGIGHILWVPMVAWLWTRWTLPLPVVSSGTAAGNHRLGEPALSLIDAVDVIRYLRGERDPYLETPA